MELSPDYKNKIIFISKHRQSLSFKINSRLKENQKITKNFQSQNGVDIMIQASRRTTRLEKSSLQDNPLLFF